MTGHVTPARRLPAATLAAPNYFGRNSEMNKFTGFNFCIYPSPFLEYLVEEVIAKKFMAK